MNAQLRPLPTTRTEYIGYRLVSENRFEEWVELNVDALAHRYFAQGGLGLDGLAAFSASEWEKERDRRDDYARTAYAFDGGF